jgi:DNA-directed RNA polymerase specialized sigma24 family protein
MAIITVDWEDMLHSASVALVWYNRADHTTGMNSRAVDKGFMEVLHELHAEPPIGRVQADQTVLTLQIMSEKLCLYIEQQPVEEAVALEVLRVQFGLAPKELQVIWQVYLGKENAEIATAIDRKVGSVKSTLFRAYSRMGVTSRSTAVRAVTETLAGTRPQRLGEGL